METAHLVKVVLFKTFIIGFILLIIASFTYNLYFDFTYSYVSKIYPIDEEGLLESIVLLMGVWKIILFQFFLFPALALQCTLKKCHKKED